MGGSISLLTGARTSLDVRDYGAIGDGVADDTAAIQAAVDEAQASGGGIITFGAGRYLISDTILITGPSVEFLGAGHDRFHSTEPAWEDQEYTSKFSSLVWDGVDGGTMVKALPPDDAGIHFSVVGLNLFGGVWPYSTCADYGLELYGVQGSRFELHVQEFREAGFYMGHNPSGDGTASCVFNRIVYLSGRIQSVPGSILRMDGVEDGGDCYNNVFDVIEGLYKDGTAIDLVHHDSNRFNFIRVQKSGDLTTIQGGASGQPVLDVSSSADFSDGQTVYLRQGPYTDTKVILSRGSGTITMTTNLTRTYEWGGTISETDAYGIKVHAVSPSGGDWFGYIYPGGGGLYIEGTENGSTDPVTNVWIDRYDSAENSAPGNPGIGIETQVSWHAMDSEMPGFGHMPYWYPIGFAHGATAGTEYDLAAAGGAIAIPVVAASFGWLKRLALRNNDTATARSAEWGLFVDNGGRFHNKLTRVYHGFQKASGTFSFTPTVASDRTSDTSNPHWHHAPGCYWLVIRNTHATSGFKIAAVAGGTLARAVVRRSTGVAALGDTIDISAWTSDTALPMVRLEDEIGGENAAFV